MSPLETVDAAVRPEGSLEVMSQLEVDQLRSSGEGGLYTLLRRCMLAVLNSGSHIDDARAMLDTFANFELGFIQQDRGLKLSLHNAPGEAFVDGKMIRGI
ncbi:MAG: pyrimidine/purine nucleosidase domain-containing protein, partial [Gammaproteobacteria bacterium]|nr:pyrimidine/purine nucleosidase domain-containing protein [Gammaproteobacteria bacterium]